jgi:DNA-binding response OmpR family regulator
MNLRFDNSVISNRSQRRYNPISSTRRIVIGPVDSALAIAAYFGDLGWDVHTARTVKEARKLAQHSNACLAVLPVRGEPETGWLGCAKLTKSGSKTKVILIGPPWDEEAERFAEFAGATAYLTDADSPETIFEVAAGHQELVG